MHFVSTQFDKKSQAQLYSQVRDANLPSIRQINYKWLVDDYIYEHVIGDSSMGIKL